MNKVSYHHPTNLKQRIDLLDIYRGFAIFGVFVVNIVVMNSTYLNQDEFAKQWTSNLDVIAQRVLQLFFYTKFFPIFSFLFGLGISIQALKLSTHSSYTFFLRRMFFLLLFGVFHILFLWSGDVLNLYAMLGFMTTFLIKRSNKVILWLSLFFLVFPFYNHVLDFFLNNIGLHPEQYLQEHTGQTVNNIIRNGTYIEGMELRVLEYISNIPILFGFLAPVAISMFLIGLYIGKNKLYLSLDKFIQQIKKPMLYMAVFTNLYRLFFLFVLPYIDTPYPDSLRPIFLKIMILSDVGMGLFYLWFVGWLWFYTHFKSILSVLRYVGRMALTNYIMHSVVGLLLFSSLGFRLYEKLSPSETLLTAVGVFIFQILFSQLWLTYFKFGPLEWIWRCLSYQKLLSIRK